jgi:hypothetical protein
MKMCGVCGNEFTPYRSTQIYCSRRCGTFAQNRKKVDQKAVKRCRTCGQDKAIADFVLAHTSCRECEERRTAGLKLCRKCGLVKPHSEFYPKPNRHTDPFESRCKACASDWSRRHNAQERIKLRKQEQRFRDRYGITVAEYQERLAAQKGACAVCKRRSASTLHVDHNHSTGAVRDLLCLRCNALLGHCAEDPAILQAAIDYLERHSHDVAPGP